MAYTVSPPSTAHREPDEQSIAARGARGETDDGVDARSDNASSVDHVVEKPAGPPLTKRQKLRRHCGRFWLWYLIASIIFLAILLPILFKVIIPAIVQAIVKNQDLPIKAGRLDCLTGTQVKLALNTSLNTPLPARVSDMTLFLYNKDTTPYSPFVNITIAGQKLKGDTKIVVQEQVVTITNESEIVNWFDRVFDSDEVDLSVRGNPTIYLGELKSDPKIDKTIKLNGLRKLAGFGIKQLQVMLPPDQKGNNIKGTINLPNWGVLSLGFGNLTFNVLSGSLKIGQITAYDVLLNPGNNTCKFDGQLYLDTLIQNLGAVIASQTAALNKGQIELNVTGNSSIVNGQHITYIEKVLNKRSLSTSMSVITLLSDVLSGVMGGGSSSIIDIFGDIFGNNTFIHNIVDHWNTTRLTGNSTKNALTLTKRNDAKDALMWNMLKVALKMKLKHR